jgi:copper transport protein
MPLSCRAALLYRAAVCCALLLCLTASIAQAHAYVIETDPKTNGTVQSGPRTVSVTFDEPITLESRAPLVVTAAGGAPYPCTKPAHLDPDDETTVDCDLAAPLPRGAYTVAWRVTSADTHVVHGVFSFGVGVAVNGPSGETTSIYDPSGALAATLRWLVYLGAALLFGGVIFTVVVLRRGAYAREADAAATLMRARARALARAGLVLAIAGSLLALCVQCAAATGTEPWQALSSAGGVITGSVWGQAWLARMIALVLAAMIVATPLGAGAVTMLPAAAVLATFSVSGHAVGSGRLADAWLPVAADFVHLVAVSLWIGGLVIFASATTAARAVLTGNGWTPFLQTMIARFSTLALGSVAAIIVTGTYAGVLHIPSLAALWGSLYGRIVVAKAALLLPLVVLGYRNLREGRGLRAPLRFERVVVAETAIIIVILALSAVLTGSAPPPPTVSLSS